MELDPIALLRKIKSQQKNSNYSTSEQFIEVEEILVRFFTGRGPATSNSTFNPLRILKQKIVMSTVRRAALAGIAWQKQPLDYEKLPTESIRLWFKKDGFNWQRHNRTNTFDLISSGLNETPFQAKDRKLRDALSNSDLEGFELPSENELAAFGLPSPSSCFGHPAIPIPYRIRKILRNRLKKLPPDQRAEFSSVALRIGEPN